MEDALYLDNSYIKEFDATVVSIKEGKFVTLDKTAFYPNGGGQPYDTGKMVTSDGKSFNVVYVGKFGRKISHQIEGEGLKEGDKVHCVIDWNRRYAHMRYHTAAHVISTVFNKNMGALITGNQLSTDKARFDFNIEHFDRDLIQKCVDKANTIIQQHLDVKTYYLPREEVEKRGFTKLAKGLPENIKTLRIIEIDNFDIQADGGTHVLNTKEIGVMELIKCENKGKNNRRLYFKLI